MDAEALRRLELQRFLKARRARAEAGEVRGGSSRRRRAGLRIEEVCALAEISVSWYGALEGGRPVSVAPRTLHRIADALRLGNHDREHLLTLASPPPERPAAAPAKSFAAVLDGFTAGPAMLVDERLTVLEFNAAAMRLYGFRSGDAALNSIPWRVFTDSNREHFYVNWCEHAQRVVGILRRNFARRLGDARFTEFVERLCAASNEFREHWEAVEVRGLAPLRKTLLVPEAGTFSLDIAVLPVPETDLALIFQTPAEDTDRHVLARVLARFDG